MLAVIGAGSAIVRELRRLLPADEVLEPVSRATFRESIDAERWLFSAGVLYPKSLVKQDPHEVFTSMRVNFGETAVMCDEIFVANPNARVCVVGSQSGFAGSYDETYAAAKAALHSYVCRKRLAYPHQQLVAVAPSIIGDAGMTLRREDRDNLRRRREEHRTGRFLDAIEVARMIHFLLYVDRGYTTGTVIRMHGETDCM